MSISCRMTDHPATPNPSKSSHVIAVSALKAFGVFILGHQDKLSQKVASLAGSNSLQASLHPSQQELLLPGPPMQHFCAPKSAGMSDSTPCCLPRIPVSINKY